MSEINYTFKNKKLFEQALTHGSKSTENYQRLEYLGDSILDFVVGEYLFFNCEENEGELTVLRSHFVSENNLCQVFDNLGLEKFANIGKSLQGSIPKTVKADMVESLIAAIYLDSDIDTVKEFIFNILNLDTYEELENDNYKSQLQELIQANFKCSIKYVTEKEDDNFVSDFYMDDDKIATGYGHNKLEAEQNCAYVALQKLFID